MPTAVGEKVTLTNTSAPPEMVPPADGAPDVSKGASGSSTDEMVNGEDPLLKNPTS